VVPVGAVLQGIGVAAIAWSVGHDWQGLSVWELVPGMAVAGLGQGLQLPVLFRLVLSEVPSERAGVGSGVMVTTQQSALTLGVATLGSLFLSLASSPAGMGAALRTTLLVQLGVVALTLLLSLRLPRTVK
jgi:hypothetical protein